jgi:signal transduction histidine kinase
MSHVVDPERLLGPREVNIPSLHPVQRSPAWVAVLMTTAALFLAGLTSPKVSAMAGITFDQGLLVVAVFVGASIVATVSFYRLGAASPLYRCFDYLEGIALSWAIAYVISASSTAHSFFWIFHAVQILMTALSGYSLIYLATVCVGPVYLVATFLGRGEVGMAWLSAVAGICGLLVYLGLARLTSERDAALKREAQLRQELGRVLVARERARISRDLHDNVATELTALIWKTRELSEVLPNAPPRVEMLNIVDRLHATLEDVRNVVLALRVPEVGFRELELIFEQRCRELCGHRDFRVTLEGAVEVEELRAFQEHILPICFELVSNAARHAGAKRIEAQLRIGTELRIQVSDDGVGLANQVWHDSRGGLDGVRLRVKTLGGKIRLETGAVGTRFLIDLPRPLRQAAST